MGIMAISPKTAGEGIEAGCEERERGSFIWLCPMGFVKAPKEADFGRGSLVEGLEQGAVAQLV